MVTLTRSVPSEEMPSLPGRVARTVTGAVLTCCVLIAVLWLRGSLWLLWVAVPVLALATAAVIAGRVRAHRRRELEVHLARAIAPLTGDRVSGVDAVRASRWRGRGVGVPRRVLVRYQPAVHDGPDWVGQVHEAIERRLSMDVSTLAHDRRRCRLVLALTDETEATAGEKQAARARLVARELFGRAASVKVETAGGDELVAVDVSHELRAKVAAPATRVRIERVFSAMLPNRWRARWDLTGDRVRFELRPVMPTAVPHPAEPLTVATLHRIPLAVDEDSQLVSWALNGSGPHLMIVGKTGTGKTVAILGAVMEFARRAWPVWVLDPKRIEFMAMRSWPNVQIVATSVEDMVATVKAAHDLMERRYEGIELRGADESEFEPLLLVLDEFRNFHRLVTAWWAAIKVRGMPTKCPVFDWVAAIAEKGRSARVHLILGTQRPDADFMTGSMRDNFDTRLAMGRLSPQGAVMMWDSPYLGTAVPRSIRGRGTAISEEERVSEVQVLWTPDPRRATRDARESDLEILARLRPARPSHPHLHVVLDDDRDLDGSDVPIWDRVLGARLVEGVPPRTPEIAPSGTPTVVLEVPAETETDPDGDVVDLDERDGFGPELTTTAGRLQPGDLVCVDETLDAWAVVEAAEPDLAAEDSICVDWRADDDDFGSLSLDEAATLRVRRPDDGEDDYGHDT